MCAAPRRHARLDGALWDGNPSLTFLVYILSGLSILRDAEVEGS
jgi:hypothetical protein